MNLKVEFSLKLLGLVLPKMLLNNNKYYSPRYLVTIEFYDPVSLWIVIYYILHVEDIKCITYKRLRNLE